MRHQGVTFENLADCLDGRLQGESLRRVEAHLAAGCPHCERDLAWLRRFAQAARQARTNPAPLPPAALVAQARASFRPRRSLAVSSRRAWPAGRPALALGVMVLLLALILSWQPGLVGRAVVLASVQGLVQVRSSAGDEVLWQPVPSGYRLSQGAALRVAEGAAVIDLFDGSRMQLEAGAEVEMSALRSSALGRAHHIAITQRNGYVVYHVASGGARSLFTVVAPSSSVDARTTAHTFAIDVADDVATQVVVLQGNVTVSHDQASLFLTDREGLMISGQGALSLLPTLAAPSFTRPKLAATATPLGAYPVPSFTPAPATRTATRAQPTVTPSLTIRPTSTRAQAPTPQPSRTPEPYEFLHPTIWPGTATPATRIPGPPSATPTWTVTSTMPTMPPVVKTAIPKIQTIVSRITLPPEMPTIPPEIKTAIPKIETIVSQITPPQEWPTMPRTMPTWPKH